MIKKINNKLLIYLISIMVAIAFTGCAFGTLRHETDAETITEHNAGEDAENISDAGEESGDDINNPEEDESSGFRKAFAQSSYAVGKNPVDGKTGLYLLDLGIDLSNININDMCDMDGNVLFIAEEFQNETYEYTLFLISPLDMKVISSVKLSGNYYYNGSINMGTNDKIAVNDDCGNVSVFDKDLNLIDEININRVCVGKMFYSNDLSDIYYFDTSENKIYNYDADEHTENQILTDIDYDTEDYYSLEGVWPEKDIIIFNVNDFNDNKNTYEIRSISTGEIIKSDDTVLQFFEYCGDDYIALTQIAGIAETVYGNLSDGTNRVLTLESYGEYEDVYRDVKSQIVMARSEKYDESSHINESNFNVYDLSTGNKIYSVKYDFDTDDEYMFWPQMLYVKEEKYAMLAYNDIHELYVIDLEDPEIKNTDATCYWYDASEINSLSDEAYNALREKADKIATENSVEIYFGDDVNNCSRDIYDYMPVNNASRIDRALDILSDSLDKFPNGMLKQLASGEGGILKIYLSGQIVGIADTAISTAVGVQNTCVGDTYLVLDITCGENVETSIYHEIYHALEKYLSSEGYYFDYDRWDECNPSDFIYDYDYVANEQSYDSTYTTYDFENEVYFIDTYSKSFPEEDRARIIEYAMMEYRNNTGYFENEAITNKLRYISEVLREGFSEADWSDEAVWESVLDKQP